MQPRMWLFVLAAVVVAGCSAGAQDTAQSTSASLSPGTSGRPGGTLVCYGERILGGAGTWTTKFHPFNNNDRVSISIDKLVVYDHAGDTQCDTLPSYVLGPHATLDLNMTKPPFSTACASWPMASSPGDGGFSVVMYWSVVDVPNGYVNGLSAYSDVYRTNSEANGFASHACEAIALHP